MKVRNQIRDTHTKIRGDAQRTISAAENDYKAAAAQEASIAIALDAAKKEALDLAARAVTYDSRKREVDVAEHVLDSLLARAKDSLLA